MEGSKVSKIINNYKTTVVSKVKDVSKVSTIINNYKTVVSKVKDVSKVSTIMNNYKTSNYCSGGLLYGTTTLRCRG